MMIAIYAVGLVCISCCADKSLSQEEIEAHVTALHPTGLDHGWEISDDSFRDGSPNPNQCKHEQDKQHWLLKC